MRNIRNQKNLPQKEQLTLQVIADDNYPAEYAPVLAWRVRWQRPFRARS